MIRAFDCFVGIDWSGARGPYQAGLAVFMAEAGKKAPQRILPPDGKYWSRKAIIDWLEAISAKRRVWPVSILPLPILFMMARANDAAISLILPTPRKMGLACGIH